MYKILLLTDFSVASRHALDFAQTLFAGIPAQFCLLHAFQAAPTEGFTGTFWLAEQRQLAETALRNFERTLAQPPVPNEPAYRTMVLLGDPVNAVETVLAQEYFDLVVVGATGSGSTELFGSVATGMVRNANTNVLVVPVSALIRPVERVVLATDYRSVNGAESFTLLKELVHRKAAHLTLLTIENSGEPTAGAAEPSGLYVLKAFEDTAVDACRIYDDDVRHGIDTYLDTHPVDLFVLLPHHKRLFDLLLSTSISRSMAYHPRVPLLTLYDEMIISPASPSEVDAISLATYP